MAIEVLTIGDPTLDTYLTIHEAHVALSLDPQSSQLCIDYAHKIPVDAAVQDPGGNAVNASMCFAALGLRPALYGVVGGDHAGTAIIDALRRGGVDTSLVDVDAEASTNSTTALLFQGERTLFVWHVKRSYVVPRVAPKWVYMTSAGPAGRSVADLHEAVCRLVDATGARLAFSPGTHQLRMGREALAGLLGRASVVLLNREEAVELTGCDVDELPELLAALHALGPATAVITDGAGGSWALDRGAVLHAGIANMPVVDRTGAGDAYSAAFVAAMMLGRAPAEAMRWGSLQAGHAVGVLGATTGLVDRATLEREIALHDELRVSVASGRTSRERSVARL